MYRGYILPVITALAAALMAALLFAFPAHAAGERYFWKSYSVIGSGGGDYEALSLSEGGVSSLDFEQSNDPKKYIAKPAENCEDGIALTLTSSSQATVSSLGNCDLAKNLTTSVTVTSGSVVSHQISTDRQTMQKAFREKNCPFDAEKGQEQDCLDAADAEYGMAVTECQAAHDITKELYLSNQYLDCIANKLGVERPAEDRDTKEEKKSDEESEKSECAIEDVGWLMCQAMSFAAWIADESFNLLSTFMEVDPLKEQVNGQDSKIRAAWKIFTGFANAIIAIALLFVIFSHITGWGISTYGIKSIMPRIIVSAVIINLSFFGCAVAIDFSNILGKTLRETLVDITPPASGSKYTTWTQLTDRITSISPTDEEYTKENHPDDNNQQQPANPQATPPTDPDDDIDKPDLVTATLMGATIVGGGVLIANLSALAPFMASAIIAMITVLVILLMRQAIIICLVVISPLAAACLALPNTKQWSKKWLDTFMKILMLYPLVSLLFGAAYFASRTVQSQAIENDQTFIAIFALGIQVIPLFLLPALLKFGNGALDNMVSAATNPNRGPLKHLKQRAQDFRDDRKNIQTGNAAAGTNILGKLNPNAARIRRKIKRDTGRQALSGVLQQASGTPSRSTIESATKGIQDGEFKDKLMEAALANASKSTEDITIDRVGATVARYKNEGITTEKAHEMALSGVDDNGDSLTDIERAAAIQMAANTAQSEKAHELIMKSADLDDSLRRVLVDSLRKNGFSKSNSHFGGSAMNKVLEGQIKTQDDVDQLVANAINGNKFSSTVLAGQSDHTLDMVNRLADTAKVTASARTRTISNAAAALDAPKVRGTMASSTAQKIETLRNKR